MGNTRWLAAALLMGATGAIAGAAAATSTRPATTPASGRIVKFAGMELDLDKRQVVVQAEVCLREGALELLLCRRNTKEHESILHTQASGAHLHAAMLALGLTSGIPAHWSGPADSGKMIPPRGAELTIQLRWKDSAGKAQQADAAAWLTTAAKHKAAPPAKWVFVGSDIAPDGQYVADLPAMGHLISVSNFPDTVIDVPFDSTSADAELEFAANTKAIPPLKTAVEVVITAAPKAETSPWARALLEIGPLGQLRMDGQAVDPADLAAWARAYIERHESGQVVLRADPRALAFDIERARQELRLGGVRDFEEQFPPSQADIPPRTAEQLAQAMTQWQQKFANPQDYVIDPAAQAKAALADLDDQLRHREKQVELLKDYRQQLTRAAGRYEASTRPTSGPATKKAD